MGKGKWNPWSGVDEFRQQMERFLDEGGSGMPPTPSNGYVWSPLADVLETPDAVIAQVELPGVQPEQVVVDIVDGDLLVRGERPFDRPCECAGELREPEAAYHLMERAHGTFARRFALPPGVDGEAVTATLREGLLTIIVPKLKSKSPARFSLCVE